MSYINDEEELIESLRVYVKANLNTEIAAINARKVSGTYQAKAITADDRHYVIGGQLRDLPNDVFVNVSLSQEIEPLQAYNDTAHIVTLLIEVAFDSEGNENDYFKSLRYLRALINTIRNYEASTFEVGGFRIARAIPMLATVDGRKLLVSGVEVSVALG